MTKAAEQVLQEALALDEEDLADLVDELTVRRFRTDAKYTAAWESEIRQRLEDVEAGRVELIPADEALRRVRESGKSHG